MDKQNSNRTITIKINGNERQILDTVSHDGKSVERVTSEQVESIDSVEKAETVELESYTEVAASEAVEESFDWILPESNDDIEEYIIAKQPASKSKEKSTYTSLKKQIKKQNVGPVKSIFTSVLLAIIIGTSFGFLVLKLVINDAKVEAPAISLSEETSSEKKDPVSTAEPQQLQLQPIETFIIQGGVFSSVDSANIEAKKFQEKGIPAQTIEDNGKAILILGVADSIENAKSIGSTLKASGIDVFAKPYSLPGKDLKELSQAEAELLNEAPAVYQALSSLIAGAMVTSALDENFLAKQKNFLASIDKQEMKSTQIEEARGQLEGAITKLEQYQKQPNPTLLNDAQQHLLSFIGAYFTL